MKIYLVSAKCVTITVAVEANTDNSAYNKADSQITKAIHDLDYCDYNKAELEIIGTKEIE